MRKSRIDRATAAWVAFYGVLIYATAGAFLAAPPWNVVDGISSAGLGLVALVAALVKWRDRVTDRRNAQLANALREGMTSAARVAAAKVGPAITLNPYRPPTDADLRRWRELDRNSPCWRDES